MKRLLFLLTAGALALSAAGQPTSGIKGTMHDLSATGYKTTTNVDQICVFCHTPHNSASGSAQIIPLWNHTPTSATFTAYTLIDGTAAGDYTKLPGVSLACLSCHDGTVAVGSLVNVPYGFGATQTTPLSYATAQGGNIDTTTGKMSGGHALGIDLSNDHPINVVWDATDTGMQPLSTLTGKNVPLFDANGRVSTVAGSTVQCASCHDVHNWGGVGITGAPFLRVNNTGSGLCLTCHKK